MEPGTFVAMCAAVIALLSLVVTIVPGAGDSYPQPEVRSSRPADWRHVPPG